MPGDNSFDDPNLPDPPIVARLEQLAQHLDRQTMPSLPAFRVPAPRPRSSRWKIAAWATGIAAAVAIAAWSASTLFTPPPQPHTPAPIAIETRAPAPRFIIVEDLDSYSVIDLNADRPIVSFTRKDSDRPPAIAILPEPTAASPATTSHM